MITYNFELELFMDGLPHPARKMGGLGQCFSKKIKFGQVIPTRQDKWTGSYTKKIPAGIPTCPLNLIY